MFTRRDLRKILLFSFKEYREKTEVPIQKLTQIERDKRDQMIILLKNTIMETFIPLFVGKREKLVKYLNTSLDEFFNPYLD